MLFRKKEENSNSRCLDHVILVPREEVVRLGAVGKSMKLVYLKFSLSNLEFRFILHHKKWNHWWDLTTFFELPAEIQHHSRKCLFLYSLSDSVFRLENVVDGIGWYLKQTAQKVSASRFGNKQSFWSDGCVLCFFRLSAGMFSKISNSFTSRRITSRNPQLRPLSLFVFKILIKIFAVVIDKVETLPVSSYNLRFWIPIYSRMFVARNQWIYGLNQCDEDFSDEFWISKQTKAPLHHWSSEAGNVSK